MEQLLREDWSPEQISGWLTREEGVSVSHERIYQHVYEDKRRGGDLHRHLRCQKPRRKRYGHYDRRGQIRERVPIDERPEVVEARSRIGPRSDSQGKVRWLGHVIGDADLFKGYLRQTVASRVRDNASGFEEALRALATTDMASEQLERLRCATPDTKSWEIGEALAECFLETEPYLDVCWPWNTVRDRRTPRASLPGADLVGFCRQEDDFWLLIGEVKTSSDASSPPGVMSGKDQCH